MSRWRQVLRTWTASSALSVYALAQPALTFEMHLVAACNSPGAGKPLRIKGGSQTVCLEQPRWASTADIHSARVKKDSQGKSMIVLTLEPDAAARVMDLTAKNLRRSVGIIINGELIAVPQIVAPDREVPIQGNFSTAEAEALAATFNGRSGKR